MIAVVVRLLSGMDHFTLDFKSIDYAWDCCAARVTCLAGVERMKAEGRHVLKNCTLKVLNTGRLPDVHSVFLDRPN